MEKARQMHSKNPSDKGKSVIVDEEKKKNRKCQPIGANGRNRSAGICIREPSVVGRSQVDANGPLLAEPDLQGEIHTLIQLGISAGQEEDVVHSVHGSDLKIGQHLLTRSAEEGPHSILKRTRSGLDMLVHQGPNGVSRHQQPSFKRTKSKPKVVSNFKDLMNTDLVNKTRSFNPFGLHQNTSDKATMECTTSSPSVVLSTPNELFSFPPLSSFFKLLNGHLSYPVVESVKGNTVHDVVSPLVNNGGFVTYSDIHMNLDSLICKAGLVPQHILDVLFPKQTTVHDETLLDLFDAGYMDNEGMSLVVPGALDMGTELSEGTAVLSSIQPPHTLSDHTSLSKEEVALWEDMQMEEWLLTQKKRKE